MREMYENLVAFLALPGMLSKTCWREIYEIRDWLEDIDEGEELRRERNGDPSVEDNIRRSKNRVLYGIIEVASKTARARRCRLPDALHNMMVLNTGVAEHYVESYIKMAAKLDKKASRRPAQTSSAS
jgi:hypothetical protein